MSTNQRIVCILTQVTAGQFKVYMPNQFFFQVYLPRCSCSCSWGGWMGTRNSVFTQMKCNTRTHGQRSGTVYPLISFQITTTAFMSKNYSSSTTECIISEAGISPPSFLVSWGFISSALVHSPHPSLPSIPSLFPPLHTHTHPIRGIPIPTPGVVNLI